MRSMELGTITITLEGVNQEQTERCRKIIHKLFELGFFNVKRGKAIVSFDHLGNLGSFQVDEKKWERKDDTRTSEVVELVEDVTITSK